MQGLFFGGWSGTVCVCEKEPILLVSSCFALHMWWESDSQECKHRPAFSMIATCYDVISSSCRSQWQIFTIYELTIGLHTVGGPQQQTLCITKLWQSELVNLTGCKLLPWQHEVSPLQRMPRVGGWLRGNRSRRDSEGIPRGFNGFTRWSSSFKISQLIKLAKLFLCFIWKSELTMPAPFKIGLAWNRL